jgi:hypothetical protein
MKCKGYIYKKHALERMISRNISFEEVEKAINEGEIIKDYPDDKPFKSCLILAIVNKKPLHIVVSQDNEGNCFVISTYEPDKEIWYKDFKTKKK